MPKRSAGVLLYRERDGRLEVLLAHPGGPFWALRDDGAWTIPKGELEPDEDPRACAARELAEEVGVAVDRDVLVALGEVRQRAGKVVVAFAVAGDVDPEAVRSNTFELEWPPRSGRHRAYPEIDRAQWFTLEAARRKMNPAQVELLDRLVEQRAAGTPAR